MKVTCKKADPQSAFKAGDNYSVVCLAPPAGMWVYSHDGQELFLKFDRTGNKVSGHGAEFTVPR